MARTNWEGQPANKMSPLDTKVSSGSLKLHFFGLLNGDLSLVVTKKFANIMEHSHDHQYTYAQIWNAKSLISFNLISFLSPFAMQEIHAQRSLPYRHIYLGWYMYVGAAATDIFGIPVFVVFLVWFACQLICVRVRT